MNQKFYALLAWASLFLLSTNADAQTITRFAGYDTSAAGGYGGDGGLAIGTAVKLNQPTGLAIDAAGNVYIAEGAGNRIRKVSSAGIISTICGDGTGAFSGDGVPATDAQVYSPRGMTIGPSGDLVIADANNYCIRKISSATGSITTIAGTPGAASSGGDGGPATAAMFSLPVDVKYDAAGNLYVCDWFHNDIRKISTTGTITSIAGVGTPGYTGDGGPATAAQLHFPFRLAFNPAGDLFFVDGANNSIRKIDMATGTITTVAGSPTGIAGFAGDGGPATASQFSVATSVKFDAAGNMYISDRNNGRIRRVDAVTNTINTVVGYGPYAFETGDGGPATAATMNHPYEMAFDAAGNLYIADIGGHTVRKVSAFPSLGTHQFSTTNNEIVLSPNPAKGTFTVRGYLRTLSDENVSLTVTNILGQVVYSCSALAHSGFVDEKITIGPGFSSGLYLLQLKAGSETTVVRFVVEQ